jgi:hypothetical protein
MLSACTGPGLIYKRVAIHKVSKQEPTPSENIATIWVHGTSQNPFARLRHNNPPGLLALSELPQEYPLTQVGEALAEHDSKEFPRSGFYAFGWAGTLSYASRKKAGADLSDALKTVQAQHKKRFGKNPRIRVVTHSHGCNVLLNASDHLAKDSQFQIDELILLACPVQEETSHKLASPVFKDIYALYSTSDFMQVLDPQGLNFEGAKAGGKLFSERRFAPQRNLVQAQIRWTRAKLTHTGFMREKFGTALPSILEELRGSKHELFALETPHDFVFSVY